MASIGSSVNAKRAARAHTLFNFFGVVLMVLLFPYFLKLVIFLTNHLLGTTSPDILVGEEKPYISRYIANAHTMFNVINAIIFLSILPYLVKVAT
ncbi:MAG: hypothetical protein JRJ73_09500 [Deltaproteobacteria bacterium]|nr:hypothetical protein [Deltaproteobacteria bacterium]MBW2052515.1 hypothetical protein [Deltaproteobacteria bacterium]